MTLTIDIDEETQTGLQSEAKIAGKGLEEYVIDVLKSRHAASGPTRRPNLGWAKGMVHMSEDFDAPLEEFKEYV